MHVLRQQGKVNKPKERQGFLIEMEKQKEGAST
jgi:hypothetical protein